MSSSAILSPQTTSLPTLPETVPSSSRPHRSRAAYTRQAREGHRDRSRESTSPALTTSSHSASMSTRSRRSFSRSLSRVADKSPEKRSAIVNGGPAFKADLERARTASSELSEEDSISEGVAVEGLQLGEDDESMKSDITAEAEAKSKERRASGQQTEEEVKSSDRQAEDDEEGENELDPLESPIDNLTVPDRSRTITPERRVDEPTKKNIIRLVLNRKRQAEEAESLDTPVPIEAASVPGAEEIFEPERGEESHQGDDGQIQEEGMSSEAAKRIPRKKRKWLKKGEVDPDDPIAVARQQQKFKLIDEALESLNSQFDELLSDTHSQMLELWKTLERRRDNQLLWLRQRYEAQLGDLGKMRDHDVAIHKSDWKDKREILVDEMILENRHKMAHITAERTALKRNPDFLPSLRSGRGAGGWNFSDEGLLSTGEQPLQPVQVKGQWRQRRALSDAIEPLAWADIQLDLQEFKTPITHSRSPSPLPPHATSMFAESRRSHSNTPRPEGRRDAQPAPNQQQSSIGLSSETPIASRSRPSHAISGSLNRFRSPESRAPTQYTSLAKGAHTQQMASNLSSQQSTGFAPFRSSLPERSLKTPLTSSSQPERVEPKSQDKRSIFGRDPYVGSAQSVTSSSLGSHHVQREQTQQRHSNQAEAREAANNTNYGPSYFDEVRKSFVNPLPESKTHPSGHSHAFIFAKTLPPKRRESYYHMMTSDEQLYWHLVDRALPNPELANPSLDWPANPERPSDIRPHPLSSAAPPSASSTTSPALNPTPARSSSMYAGEPDYLWPSFGFLGPRIFHNHSAVSRNPVDSPFGFHRRPTGSGNGSGQSTANAPPTSTSTGNGSVHRHPYARVDPPPATMGVPPRA